MTLTILAGLALADDPSLAVAAAAQAAGEGTLIAVQGESGLHALIPELEKGAPYLLDRVRVVEHPRDVPGMLAAEGAPCALLVAGFEDRWWLTPYGSCRGLDAGDLFAITADLPPAVARPPGPAPAPEDLSLAKLERYERERLERGREVRAGLARVGPWARSEGWEIRDGGGRFYTAVSFAEASGDAEMERWLERERQLGVGAALVMGMVGVGFMIEANDAMGEDPGPIDGMFGAMFFDIGAVIAVSGATIPFQIRAKQKRASRYYTSDEADARIEEYNRALRESLGLTEEDVQSIDLSAAPPAIQLQPVVGPGWVGVAGSF